MNMLNKLHSWLLWKKNLDMKIFVRMMKHLIISKNSMNCNCADGLSFWLFV